MSLYWARRICAGFCKPTLTITMKSEPTGPWTKIRLPIAGCNGSGLSNHTRCLADFIPICPGLGFRYTQLAEPLHLHVQRVHEPVVREIAERADRLPGCERARTNSDIGAATILDDVVMMILNGPRRRYPARKADCRCADAIHRPDCSRSVVMAPNYIVLAVTVKIPDAINMPGAADA
jgi:hypothetical protein